jgi:UDP-glucose 4-epimerase
MRILVTGAAGFLGRHVVSAVQPTIALDNYDPLCGSLSTFRVQNVDVRDFDTVEALVKNAKITHIIHLAAYGRNLTCQDHPKEAWDVNVTGTRNILEAARLIGNVRVVCCSSNITLSDKPTVYRTTKLVVESLIELYDSMGVSCVGIRPSNIYGSGQSQEEYQPCAFAGLDSSFVKNGHFTITGDGTQSRDWVHAEDVAKAFKMALCSYESGFTYDVATGKQTSMNEIANILGVQVKYVAARPGDAQTLVSKRWLGANLKLEDRIWDAFPSVPRP